MSSTATPTWSIVDSTEPEVSEGLSALVPTALWPCLSTASANARPSPVEQPVMSQVAMSSYFLVLSGDDG